VDRKAERLGRETFEEALAEGESVSLEHTVGFYPTCRRLASKEMGDVRRER